MPCESAYLEPTHQEIISSELCRHITYLNEKLEIKTPKWIEQGGEDHYGCPGKIEALERLLIKRIFILTPKQKEKLIYNGREKRARSLADWWDAYKERALDEKKEKVKRKRKEIRAQKILKKLRKDEIKIIRDYFKNSIRD